MSHLFGDLLSSTLSIWQTTRRKQGALDSNPTTKKGGVTRNAVVTDE